LSSQTPKKKRGRPRKNEQQVQVQEPLETFKPKVEKVEKVELPPRRFGAAKFKEHPLDRTLKGMTYLLKNLLTFRIIEQNKLFDDLNKESPTITLNNAPKSILNAGGSKIFEVPPSTMIVDAAPKELPKKRVKCKLLKISRIIISIARKLAEPSQSPLESSSEEVSDGSEYVPAYKKKTKERNRVKLEVERPRSSSKKIRKTRDGTTKLKRTKVHDFKSSSEEEELGIVRKPGKVDKTPVLHKKSIDKISRKTKFFRAFQSK